MKVVSTFLVVVIGWVLFRADNFPMARVVLRAMFIWSPGMLPIGWPLLIALLLIAGGLAHFGPNTFEMRHKWRPSAASALAILFAACLLIIYGGQQSPFLYFQF